MLQLIFNGTMKETLSKMSELKFEAPLAQFEETEEWQSAEYRFKNINEDANHVRANENFNKLAENGIREENAFDDYKSLVCDSIVDDVSDSNIAISDSVNNNVVTLGDNFDETVSGSLEDLVNTFDEKITRCFYNYQENVENLAPVQVRSQEDIMNECQ